MKIHKIYFSSPFNGTKVIPLHCTFWKWIKFSIFLFGMYFLWYVLVWYVFLSGMYFSVWCHLRNLVWARKEYVLRTELAMMTLFSLFKSQKGAKICVKVWNWPKVWCWLLFDAISCLPQNICVKCLISSTGSALYKVKQYNKYFATDLIKSNFIPYSVFCVILFLGQCTGWAENAAS